MTLRIAGTLVWFAAAALAVGFGVIDADGPSAPTAATHPRAVITTVETIRVGGRPFKVEARECPVGRECI